MGNKFIHLTNSSIQKMNAEGPTKDNPLMMGAEGGTGGPSEDTGGSKMAMLGKGGLLQRLTAGGYDVDLLWRNICLVVLKSLVAVDDKMTHQPCCFEVFGYDVLIDADLRPWLIEVNASPSMSRDNPLDVRVKNAMIRDTILLLEPAPYDRAAVARVLKRRLNDLAKNKANFGKSDPDLERDLKEILGNFVPRLYGEEPKHMGDYQRLCPSTKIHAHVLKLRAKLIKTVD